MIASVSVCNCNPRSIRFTVQELAGRVDMFRVGVEINGIEVADLFDVPRKELGQLESAIRAALIDSEGVDLSIPPGPPPTMPDGNGGWMQNPEAVRQPTEPV